ncbi:ABC transporter permease [Cellulomonas sp. Sa3CUA2]|uniref:ABC transporter permease n=2 Tax=Cellulomonas avistercoris TaxID=2762242 RepID=A0ABR8QCV7_9CELL|nr:ABC transporter permease [Cellulomonas avistercoris]
MTVALGAVLAVLLAIFILPSLRSGPHDLPVGVTGPASAVPQVEAALAAAAPDAYAVQRFDSQEALVAAVHDRDVVGGFVVDGDGIRSVVTSAGGAAIAQSLTASAQGVGTALGLAATSTDVVPLPAADPAGIGIGGLAFPLVFGGIVPVVAFRTAFARRTGWRLGGLLTFSVVGGLVVAAVLRFGFGSIETAFWPVAAAMALGIAAMAFPLTGLQEAFGGKGFTIGAMSMMFLGNPFAGIATTSAWLPSGLGAFGQILPPGATGTLVRSVAYFGGTGGLTAGLTLGAWVVVGLVVHTIGTRRGRQDAPATALPSAA